MRNIKNLKDPTTIILITLALTLWRSTIGAAQLGVQNVTCIAHDTQFTCDCQNAVQAMVLPPLFGRADQVEIRNCRALTIEANALADTRDLQRIKFKRVDKLVLNKYALAIPRHASDTSLIVAFEEVNFELIDSHAISGNIAECTFIGGSIELMQPFGFTTVMNRAILFKMDGVRVRRIEQQAFKKFVVEQMEIKNCNFEGNMPTRVFYELDVLNELSIQNNHFREVHSHAFSFKLISKLSIAGNTFTRVDGEWFEGYVRESIVIRENNFGTTSEIAFRAIQLHRDYQLSEPLELRFINNTVLSKQPHTGEPQALEFNANFALGLKGLRYNDAWSCQALDTAQKPPVPKSAFFRTHSDNIYFRRGDATTTTAAATTNAIESNNSQSFLVLSKVIEWDCARTSYVAYIVIGSVLLVTIIALIVLLIFCLIVRKRKRRKMDVVQPEPRTYKETQIIYQIENAGLLKTDL